MKSFLEVFSTDAKKGVNVRLDRDTHTYQVQSNGKSFNADTSITSILNHSTYVSKKMKVAAEYGIKAHETWIDDYREELDKFMRELNIHPSNTNVSLLVEQSFVGRHKDLDGNEILIGGTPDLVLVDWDMDRFYVVDFKTATKGFDAKWRLQLAYYAFVVGEALTYETDPDWDDELGRARTIDIELECGGGYILTPTGIFQRVLGGNEGEMLYTDFWDSIDKEIYRLNPSRRYQQELADNCKLQDLQHVTSLDVQAKTKEAELKAQLKEIEEERSKYNNMRLKILNSINKDKVSSYMLDDYTQIYEEVELTQRVDTEAVKLLQPDFADKWSKKSFVCMHNHLSGEKVKLKKED